MTSDTNIQTRAAAAVEVLQALILAGDLAGAQTAADVIEREGLWQNCLSDSGLPFSRFEDFLAAVQDDADVPTDKRLYVTDD